MNIIRDKLLEALASVAPIFVIVLLLHLFVNPLDGPVFLGFLLGSLFVYLGLAIFLVGVDIGIGPVGEHLGRGIAKSNRILIVIGAGLLLGFVISIAEPDLMVFAEQVGLVTRQALSSATVLVVVSIGVALLVAIGLLRIVFGFPLHRLFLITYLVLAGLAAFSPPEFLAIALDASGATTGALTTPFILALALGASMMKRDSRSGEEDSFGLVGLASAGATFSVLAMAVLTRPGELQGELPLTEPSAGSLLRNFFGAVPIQARSVLISLLPILIIFFVVNHFSFRLRRRQLLGIAIGLGFTFLGLVIFLAGVHEGFMSVGAILGANLAARPNPTTIILVAFVLGLVTILAEPAVHVLTTQVEEVTSGYVRRPVVLGTLSIGISLALTLSVIRIIVPQIQLWHFILPGYILAIVLMFFTPRLFIGIAFDSGGVASGPMTATFVLAFAHGAAQQTPTASIMRDGFGIIAMVAMMPLIVLQILGIVFDRRARVAADRAAQIEQGVPSQPEGSVDDDAVELDAVGIEAMEALGVDAVEASAPSPSSSTHPATTAALWPIPPRSTRRPPEHSRSSSAARRATPSPPPAT